MALKGLDIFKLTPKTNCKQCGVPTCMAFSMKVAQGSLPLEKCPFITDDVKDQLSEATAPPMKTLKLGEHTLGGETVLERHEKTFVSKTLYAMKVSTANDDAANDALLEKVPKVDYDRIGERMYCEFVFVEGTEGENARFLDLVKKAAALDRDLILATSDADLAKEALAAASGKNVILAGANASNYEAMSGAATAANALLGVSGESLEELHDTVAALEKLGNKNLVLVTTGKNAKEAFRNTVEVRRGAIKGSDRTFGYPSLVDVAALSGGDPHMEAAYASLFTAKYGSIVVLTEMDYAKALPLYGLRQNIFTDPQKPMKVDPGIYPLNGADENSICMVTVDFALTYFIVSGEIERSGIPVNLLISDAGGYSVLTAWAAGKFSASSIAKFIEEYQVEEKIKNRVLVLPGKVAVLKGEVQEKLPNWKVVVGTNEAVEIIRFLKDFQY
ncbi:MAG: acetyl-CoA decarbonylase/synthase complex subunit gamma [Lachnospiraceae bacterium]|nr:acetyl-CoA decarbonylase/synthase complex subunit gamma [Lachnospiraceae bacterium]